jgi:aminoglycoside phosphotransferase
MIPQYPEQQDTHLLGTLIAPQSDQEIKLAGHSGAVLTIERVASTTVLRKQAALPELSLRLRQQAAKQMEAWKAGIPCPRIIHEGENSGRYFFDMEYIPSVSLAERIIRNQPIDCRQFSDFVTAWLKRILSLYWSGATQLIPADLFHHKLEEIAHRSESLQLLRDLQPNIKELIQELRRRDWSNVPFTECHGDFTLENILITRSGSHMLIDFDIVPFSSYVLDIAKLYQDLVGLWCLRHLALERAGTVELLNASIAIKKLRNEINAIARDLPGSSAQRMPQFVALHLLRVLPYCKDSRIGVFTLMQIQSILDSGLPS